MQIKFIRTIILLIISIFPGSVVFSQTLNVSDNDYSAGYATLNWSSATGNMFELEENSEDGWVVIYKGQDRATSLSGLPDGTYSYRLISDGIQVGETINFTVQHYSLKNAWAFFSMGAFMLAVLILVLIRGNLKINEQNTSI